MQIGTCWECDRSGEVHTHHPIPRSLGGKRSILLCPSCHAKVHQTGITTSALTKAGLAAKRERGERYRGPGSPMIGAEADEANAVDFIRERHAAGASLRAIVAELDAEGFAPRGERWHVTTVRRIIARG